MAEAGERRSTSGRPSGWATAAATVVAADQPRFSMRRGRDLRTGERLTKYFVTLNVRPKNRDPFNVEGVLLADMEISIGSKLRVHYDPRRPSRWTLAPRAMYSSIPRRPAAEVARPQPTAAVTPPPADDHVPVPVNEGPEAPPVLRPVSIAATVDLADDAVWADHHQPPAFATAAIPASEPLATTPLPTSAPPLVIAAAGDLQEGQPIGELSLDLTDALSDSMTERFQALTLGGGFPTPADIAAMAGVISDQAERRQAGARHRPSSHRPAPPQERDLATQLTDLSRLHLAGALNNREFAMAKAHLLEP